MKIYFILLVFFLTFACPRLYAETKGDVPGSTSSRIPIQTGMESVTQAKASTKPLYGEQLTKITVSKESFNPSHGESVAVTCYISRPAKVIMNVYDPDWGLVKTLVDEKAFTAGEKTVTWDGTDIESKVVPDEAYFFEVVAEDEKGTREVYDPTTFSGGVEHDITSAEVSPQSGTITYTMPEMGRVLIRIGTQGGPLLNTLVDWKPRVKGLITEYWNGKDEDGLVDLYGHTKFKMLIAYFTLPEGSVITYGNAGVPYREYRKALVGNRPQKERRDSSVAKISHHYSLTRTLDYSPRLKVTLSNVVATRDDGSLIIKGKTLVKVDLQEEDREIFRNQQFEVVFFLDHEFFAEDESGYTPFNWVWDLTDVKEGEHILTVNLSGFKDQIGIKSQKVIVTK